MNDEYVIVGGELYHYGVPGMKWGHRKATYVDPKDYINTKKFKKDAKAQYKAAKIKAERTWDRETDAIDRRLEKKYAGKNSKQDKKEYYKEVDASYNESYNKARKAISDAKTQYKAAKVQAKAMKKMEKIQAKEIKEYYRQECLKGKSFLEKAWIKFGGGDKIYADSMYELNKRYPKGK